MLRISRTRSYLVPVVLRTLDIVEVLRKSDSPLKANELAATSQISRSTTYRILRTLLERGYVCQNLDGSYSIQHAANTNIIPSTRRNLLASLQQTLNNASDLSGDEIVEMLLVILRALRREQRDSNETK